MLIIIASAKTMKFHRKNILEKSTNCLFQNEVTELVNTLKSYSEEEIGQLMKISGKLAKENYLRYQNFFSDKTESKEAILAFSGDVYRGIDVDSFNEEDLIFAEDNLRILSGLYGVIRPFDMIKEYRLEMATKLKNSDYGNLYNFWNKKITDRIIKDIESSDGDKVLINLASKEYSDAIDLKQVNSNYRVIDIEFKERKDDVYRVIATYSKKARGIMTRYIIKNKIKTVKEIKIFNLDGYRYNDDLSSENKWVFTR